VCRKGKQGVHPSFHPKIKIPIQNTRRQPGGFTQPYPPLLLDSPTTATCNQEDSDLEEPIPKKLTTEEKQEVAEWLQGEPCLYDHAHPRYRDTGYRDGVLTRKAKSLNMTCNI
jgi:hypothetical protein